MRAVGVKALKNRLSEYLRLVATGEVVLVTDRDRVVAELRPPRRDGDESAGQAMLAEDIRQGVIRPALVRADGPPRRVPVAPTRSLLEGLDEDRGAR